VDDEKIYSVLDGRADRLGRSIDSCAYLRDRTRVFDLETIQRIRPVLDLFHAKEIAAIIHQLGYGCHRVSSTQRGAD
jgi:hypothetical protein